MKKYKPVVIFRAKNDFEAQYARDILKNNNIQVLHVPSPTVAIYGTLYSRRVAVNEDDVDRAIVLLKENQLIVEKEGSLGKGRDMEDAVSSFWGSRQGKRMGLIYTVILPLMIPYLLWRFIKRKRG